MQKRDNPFNPLHWRLDPPEKVLADPGYVRRSEARQRTLVLFVSIIALILNPLFHLVLAHIPGVPPEDLLLRVFPMILGALLIPYFWPKRPLAHTRVGIVLIMAAQIGCALSHVVLSGNSLFYAAGTLLAIFATQLVCDRLKDLIVILGVTFGWYVVFFFLHGRGELGVTDYAALLILSGAVGITVSLGGIRFKDLENLELSRMELAKQSLALEQAESSARHAAEAAIEASKAKSQFLATMSHELRTPLNAIIGYSELLSEITEDDGYDHITPDLERIHTSASHLLKLISEILDLSKVEAGQMTFVPEVVALKAFTEELTHMGQTLALTNQNTFTCTTRDVPETITSDSVKLRQVLLNLLSNAAKFTTYGEIELMICGAGEHHIEFIVRDTGIGMNDTQLGLLFQPFSQVHDTQERERYGGTGLGLMLSKRLIELLNGSIKVSSTPQVGTTFTVHLPVSPHQR